MHGPAARLGPGRYFKLNIFDSPTGTEPGGRQRETLPLFPRGLAWKPLSVHSAEELRDRAAHYRRMAATASTAQVMDGLSKLARRFDALAERASADRASADRAPADRAPANQASADRALAERAPADRRNAADRASAAPPTLGQPATGAD